MSSWSASGSINNTFKLVLNTWENGYDIGGNYSDVHWEVILRSEGNYSFAIIGSTVVVNVDGEVYNHYSQKNLNKWNSITIASGDKRIWHNNDGSKVIYCSASYTQNATDYYTPGNMSCGGDMWLTTIPRYANISISPNSSTVNSITYNFSTDATTNYKQYSLNGSGWIDDGSSNTIKNLSPNINYSVKVKARRADSGLWSESNSINIATKDIAKITNVGDLVIGQDLKFTCQNPASASMQTAIYNSDGTQELIGYRSFAGLTYTYNFTDEEIKTLYKYLGNSNSYQVRVYIKTTQNNSNYYSYTTTNAILNGDIKTIKLKRGNMKSACVYVGNNGVIKRAVPWICKDGKIMRCI